MERREPEIADQEELLLLRQHFRETWRFDDFASMFADQVANREWTVEEALRRLDAAPARKLAVRLRLVPEQCFVELRESLVELAW